MSKAYKGVGQRIREMREGRFLSQSALARLVGVTPTAVWNWETNGVLPRADTLSAIARALGTSEEYLLSGNQPEPPVSGMSAPFHDMSLEELIRAIAAKGFEVTIRPKSD